MRITQALLGEHGAMYPLLDFIEQTVPSATLDAIRVQAQFLRSTLVSHAAIEDTVLRPAIERHLPKPALNPDGSAGPTDHEVIEVGLRAVIEAPDTERARLLLLDTVAKTRKHFAKEEKLIFGIAERELSDEAQNRLGAEWAARRAVFVQHVVTERADAA
jgi:hemerythrin-like domain-containing protein